MVARSHFASLALIAATLGCERSAARAARDTVATAPTDTIVRRVYFVVRRAAAMERPTGVVRALKALEPLDSVLAVRVFDQRGKDMSGVPVQWTLANAGEGAAIHEINAKTDTLGLSRATFTPGLSADGQSAVATVADVGHIDFTVTVPVTSVRVVPDRTIVWSGDDALVGAELRDIDGHLLAGGVLSWATTDTSALHVRLEDATHARVTGALAGTTTLVAWVGDGRVRGTGHVTVRPVVIGRFVTIDGAPVPPVRMEIRAGDVRDSIAVDNGQFTKRVDLPLETAVDVYASAGAAAPYHEIHLRATSPRELQNLRIALVPTMWRIDAGSYRGREIPIDAERAMRHTARAAPFWRLVPISGRGPRKLLGWAESDFPLRLAFNRRRSSEPISASDSIAFWAIAREMEQDLGASLFVPAEIRGDSTAPNLVSVEITAQASQGHTFVSWGQPGDASTGVVLLRQAATLRDAHVVTHELVHLLGFGHSTWWTTVAEPIGGHEPRLTPDDVAYIQLAMRLRHIQQETGARPGLPVAEQ